MFGELENLFEKAMNIQDPWYIKKTEFKMTGDNPITDGELHIWIDFKKGAKFFDEDTKTKYGVYDTKKKVYRHLNFFQYSTYIHIRTPRIKTKNEKTKTILIDFVRNNSGFTLLMEAFILQLVKGGLPILKIAELIGETDTKIWNMLFIYSTKGREQMDLKNLKRIGVDETSSKKGHNYIAPVVDLEEKNIVFIGEGKKSDVFKQFAKDLFLHNGDSENIEELSIDFSPSFKKGAKKYFSKANLVFDKFHLIKMMNEVIDSVRKKESKVSKELKKSKLLLLKNEENLKEKQSFRIQEILRNNMKLLEVYVYKGFLQEFYKEYTLYDAKITLNVIIELMKESNITEIRKFGKSLNRHKYGILNHWINKTTNAILEGLNSQIQTIKRISRGFRNLEYFKSIIYIKLGKLDLSCINPVL